MRDAAKEFQWEPVYEFNKPTQARGWRVFVPHLAIDVWRRPRDSDTDALIFEYAVVYRGTVGGGGWVSNFRALTAVTPLVWDQYRQARRATKAIIEQIDELHNLSDRIFERKVKTRVLITAVGHSLGAGLAMHVHIKNARITRVVGFDPSPVDGSSAIPIEARSEIMSRKLPDPHSRNVHASVFLLYEKGDFLSRLSTCHTGPIWGSEGGPFVSCESVNFATGNWFQQHSMSQLACNLYLHSRPVNSKH